ncbi:5'-nucleotidase, cytosolic III [Apophysomyces ossiformis]|uniref:5'-nucleotidase n=1 Tax=Apophysomyces ossiformis TaxID=679940 RepID=A0A8H7BM03_9FUNG|nr:5'-nucleotidase, cytosolic III [Apophysomyces ossiformis]
MTKMTEEYLADMVAYLSQLKIETKRIYDKYYPIEINRNMMYEEKVPFMVKWWQEAHQLMIKEGITKKDIEEMVEYADVQLRPKLDTVLDICREKAIPFLVFSAGIGNIIEQILKNAGLYHENMHIVSNMMQFDEEGRCYDFAEPLIHVFNKSEFQLETTPYYKQIEHRKNVILVGDSLGDLQMSQGIKHDLCLNIGFLNHDIEALEPKYTKAFDIVIVGDANMDPIVDLLKAI